MTRAAGKHVPRGAAPSAPSPEPDRTVVEPGDTPLKAAAQARPGTPEARYAGVSDRTDDGFYGSPIPGGRPHLGNHPTVRNRVVSPEPGPEFDGMMAHGVPAARHTPHERAEAMRGPNGHARTAAEHAEHVEPVPPVPVYLVSGRGEDTPRRLAAPMRVFVRPLGQEPSKLCGLDPRRYRVGLLNEDAAVVGRIADLPGALAAPGTGQTMAAALPAVTNSYLWIHTQGELWANADGTAGIYVSVIQEFDQP